MQIRLAAVLAPARSPALVEARAEHRGDVGGTTRAGEDVGHVVERDVLRPSRNEIGALNLVSTVEPDALHDSCRLGARVVAEHLSRGVALHGPSLPEGDVQRLRSRGVKVLDRQRDGAVASQGLVGQPRGMTVLARLALPGEDVALRRAVADDVPAIVDLLADDELGAGRDGIGTEEDLQAYLAAFRQIDADPAHLLLVATGGSHVVATMQLTFLPGLSRRAALRAQVEAVRIRSDVRGRGLGAALLEWAIDEAVRRGCALVQLTSDTSRTDAHRFYERLGFVASHQGFKLALPPEATDERTA